MAKRRGHYTCIGDDHVEGFTPRQQPVGASAHALKTGEIKRNQLNLKNEVEVGFMETH
jgi:hypothetical protein